MNTNSHRFDARLPYLKGTIFIVTYGRSGSTLLQTLLQSIPDAHILGENNNVMLHLWRAFNAAKGAKAAWAPKGGDRPEHPWYGTSKYRPHDFGMRMADAFMFNVLCPPHSARWVGFKEIRYNSFEDGLESGLDFMARNFKNPFFIFNVRNADSVANSSWWRSRDPESVKKMIFDMDRRFENYVKKNPKNSFLNKYEDLVQKPETVEPMFKMLGEDFSSIPVSKILQRTLCH